MRVTHRPTDCALRLHDRSTSPGGFTLVELLIVVAVVGVLVALILPAVQSAREAARRTQCINNIKQLSLGLLSHHDTHNHFPYGGWGSNWGGVPGRGSGIDQPGSWIYSVLPEIGEEPLHQLGLGATGEEAKRLYSQRVQTPLPIFNCPTRGRVGLWPTTFDPLNINRTPKPYAEVDTMARSDYAINGGVILYASITGPESLDPAVIRKYWTGYAGQPQRYGVSQWQWGARMRQIIDGASNTYLIGEKLVLSKNYFDGSCLGDNESMYNGYGVDMHRHSGSLTLHVGYGRDRVDGAMRPYRDSDHWHRNPGYAFGSPHESGAIMSKCDGSVEVATYDIDWLLYLRNGHRCDMGEDWDASEL